MIQSFLVNVEASTGNWVQMGTIQGEIPVIFYAGVAFNMRTPFATAGAAAGGTGTDYLFAPTQSVAMKVDPSKTWLRGNSGAGTVSWIRQD